MCGFEATGKKFLNEESPLNVQMRFIEWKGFVIKTFPGRSVILINKPYQSGNAAPSQTPCTQLKC